MQDEEFKNKNLLSVILNNAKLREQWEKEGGAFTASGGDAIDQQIDKFNNEIGIRYGLEKPFLTKQQLLEQLYEDHYKNRKARLQKLGY